MNRTIKKTTIKHFHYNNHDQLHHHLDDFVSTYNFTHHLKTLKSLTPYEYVYNIWTNDPKRFKLNPIHQMPKLYT